MTMTTITRPFAFSSLFTAALSLLLLAAAPTADAQGASVPSKWQQGRHYRSVSPQMPTSVAPGKVEVLEIFWYGCGACYMLDPYLESWKKKDKPANVEFVRVPVTWNEGAKWYWDTLVDADLGANTMGWQWAGGCGADAAPYFRVFNPVLQGEKFDPDGEYVRRWVPELAKLPAEWIHQPWEAPMHVLAEAGIKLGKDYPVPLIGLTEGRDRALKALKALRP